VTRVSRTAPLLAALVALALAGCAAPAAGPSSTPEPEAASGGDCAQVAVVVDFGPLDEPAIADCVAAGPAADILGEAGITTEGTVDYGDQVVCRVNGQPSADAEVTVDGQAPFVETCQTLSSVAYWALWVKNSPAAEWEYAQEGVTTLELADGQSVGLVYTPGTESIPPQG
jgi:hypothetical protein